MQIEKGNGFDHWAEPSPIKRGLGASWVLFSFLKSLLEANR